MIFCDFETQSPIDLRKEGAKVYIQHPYTRIMSGVFIADGKTTVWVPKHIQLPTGKYPYPIDRSEGFPAAILQLAKYRPLVAHNAELFDAWLIGQKYPKYKLNWIDTIHYCRAAGLPGKLDLVLKILFDVTKLDNTAMLMLCEAKIQRGKPHYPIGNAALWTRMLDYNIRDVQYLERIYKWLASTGVVDREKKLIAKHEEINKRGFKIDRNLVVALRQVWAELQKTAVDEVAKITNGALTERDLFSPIKVKSYLQSLGYKYNTLDAKMVNQILLTPENFLEGDDAASMLAILATRKNAIRATTGKLDRILNEIDDDDVARRSVIHHGAHTGRATGRGINPLNFPRGVALEDGLYDKLQQMIKDKASPAEILATCKNSGDVLNTFTRHCIIPHGEKFRIADYNAIEARLVGWFADCKGLMEAFNDTKRDVYCEMASKLFGREITPKDETERFIGKTIVLGCIAKDTPVLTDSGWKKIQYVTRSDLVWDGEAYVKCDGAIYKGQKQCYNVNGVWMTPDHKVLTSKGWVESCQLSENTHFRASGWFTEDSRYHLLSLENEGGSKELLQLASVGQLQNTIQQIYRSAGQRNAMRVLKNKPQSLNHNMPILCTTQKPVQDYLTGFLPSTLGAITKSVLSTNTTVKGGSKSILQTEKSFWATLSHYRDGITRNLKLTESTMTETMQEETCALQRDPCNARIVETYDLLNCGLNNRFQAGNLIVHNCGYQMGHTKFDTMCKIYGINLAAAGVDAKTCVKAYRETYPEVKRLWHKLEDNCRAAVECPGMEFETCRVKFYRDGSWLLLTLPSGRVLRYRDISVDRISAPWNEAEMIDQVHYTTVHNYRKSLYGGILAENICQATGRDLLYDALLQLEKTCLHVYDEVAGEDDLETMVKVMSKGTVWSKNLTIKVEGFESPYYTKAKPKGAVKKVAINGKLI